METSIGMVANKDKERLRTTLQRHLQLKEYTIKIQSP